MRSLMIVVALGCSVSARALPRLSPAQQAAAARAIIAEFPAGTSVDVDEVGLPTRVDLAVSQPPTDDELVALVRAHAAAFGIVDATELPHVRDGVFLRIGAGARWTGALQISSSDGHVKIFGHLWPVITERVAPAEVEALVRPYYGLHGAFLSKCLPGCGHPDESFVIDRASFHFATQMAVVCAGDHVDVRPAIAIERTFVRGNVPGMEALPELVDAHTLEPIRGAFVMPGDGEASGDRVVFGAPVGGALSCAAR